MITQNSIFHQGNLVARRKAFLIFFDNENKILILRVKNARGNDYLTIPWVGVSDGGSFDSEIRKFLSFFEIVRLDKSGQETTNQQIHSYHKLDRTSLHKIQSFDFSIETEATEEIFSDQYTFFVVGTLPGFIGETKEQPFPGNDHILCFWRRVADLRIYPLEVSPGKDIILYSFDSADNTPVWTESLKFQKT